MDKYQGVERRKYQRVNAHFVVSYRVKEVVDDYDLSQSKNISQGGIYLTTNRHFDVHTHLIMTIRFPFSAKKIEVSGTVVSCKEVVKNLLYDTRICFLNVDTAFFQKLGDFVQQNLKGSKKLK